jgi:hypothetical protein
MTNPVTILKKDGIEELTKRVTAYLYRRTIRRVLPTIADVKYSGVPISRERKLGDTAMPGFLIPGLLEDIDGYESALISALQSHLRPGDKVTIVGGGEGVTAVIAAKGVGEIGSVVCFEGSSWVAQQVRATAARNGVSRRLTVTHAIVGAAIEVYGAQHHQSALVIRPEDLPECDVLELDCEGSELGILRNMAHRPRVITVETHGVNGSPTSKVKELLEGLDYRVRDCGVAETRLSEFCERNDMRVLAAERNEPARSQ